LRPEEGALGPLDDGLVDALRGVVHNDGACLEVDFGVDFCFSDEINDPLLALGVAQTEAT